YVPGGVFLMGSRDGDSDELPWHPVWLSPYWMAETPVSWPGYARLLDWQPAPMCCPREPLPPVEGYDGRLLHLYEMNKLRRIYCRDDRHFQDNWFATSTPSETKPMVAVDWDEAVELAQRLSTATTSYALPTEAQWEKAARGGLIGARYAWGDEPPSPE